MNKKKTISEEQKDLIEEFSLTRDVCASKENHKLFDYWTIEDDALTKKEEKLFHNILKKMNYLQRLYF